MPWHTIRCRHQDWQRDFKRRTPADLHHADGTQAAFILAARTAAVGELHASGQARFAGANIGNTPFSNEVFNLAGDPGPNFRQF